MQQTAEINVTGHGTVSATPDGIQIDLSVVSKEIDYPQTLFQLNERVAKIIEAIARAGVSETVFTKTYAISEIWTDQYDDEKRKFQGYKANQKLAVTIPLDTALLGSVVKELAAGNNKSNISVSFVIRDMENMKKQARVAAANNAKEAATDLANAAGLQLLSVKTIKYSGGRNSSDSGFQYDGLSQYSASPSDTIKPDLISHDETVDIVWIAIQKLPS